MMLSPYGIREWGTATVVAAGATWAAWAFLDSPWWVIAIFWVLWAALAAFFRDPSRKVPGSAGADDFVSPADGVITAIERVDHHEATSGPAVVIRIFLSVLDVHVNRAPCDGVVVECVHRPGKYLDARRPESAKVNESNLIVLVRGGERLGVRQVSGAIARRIVCPLKPGDRLERGQRFGMIKFGSTTELILPRPGDVTVLVSVGQRVWGTRTIVARLVMPPHAA